jgi:hypothetical protein
VSFTLEKKHLTQEDKVARFRNTHGERSDHSKFVYQPPYISVPVICQNHGEFPIKPLNHWRGQSCRKCARLSQRTSNKLVKVPAALA